MWEVSYGTERGNYPVKQYSSIGDLAKLVAHPRQPVHLRDLVDAGTRALLDSEDGKARGTVLDNPAVSDIRRRLRSIDDNSTDPLVRKEAEEDRAQLDAELKKLVGLGGRKRKLGATVAEQAWDALTKGLRRLWRQTEPRLTDMPELATHLRNAVLFKFPTITYHLPETSPSWNVEG